MEETIMFNETVTLSNGVIVPQLALGTWLIDDEKAAEAVRAAVSMGYRHVDTAQAYANERGVGEGVRTCGIPRNQLFVTSKVAAEYKTYESAAASIDETLNLMGLDYLDMMIIHSPQPWVEVNQSDNRYIEGNRAAWRALEDALKAGKLRAIGVSNFLEEDIDSLWEAAEIKPMVNQVLCHISNTPLDLISYCQEKGIVMEAYSPVAHGEALKNPAIGAMAEKYGVSIPQLCIRYDLQLGMITLPKTANPVHMKSNSEVDFSISTEDMETLKHIERIRDYGDSSFFPVFGGKLKGYSGKPGTEEI
jgi:diketogulonate reductase-like aldo/keto reductase